MTKNETIVKELKAFAELLYQNGFTVLISAKHPYKWLHFEKNGNFGDVQPDGYFKYNFGTEHKPSKECGTGLQTARGVELSIEHATNALVRPSWAIHYNKVQFYKDVNDFINYPLNRSLEYYQIPKKYTLEELENMPTIHEGHFDNIKFQSERFRVCLSRAKVKDGAEYDNQVTVLELQNGNWIVIDQYEAK